MIGEPSQARQLLLDRLHQRIGAEIGQAPLRIAPPEASGGSGV
jgi:hypothetical protein